jgi:hypothetical protein
LFIVYYLYVGFVSSSKSLRNASPEDVQALASHLQTEFPDRGDDLRAASNVAPHLQHATLAHAVHGILQAIAWQHVLDGIAQPTGRFVRTAEEQLDHALRGTREILASIPRTQWEILADIHGCPVALVQQQVWARVFNALLLHD